jgi:hypothetical protein
MQKLATQHPTYSKMVVTQKGIRTRAEALDDGYELVTADAFYAAMTAPPVPMPPPPIASAPQPIRPKLTASDVKLSDAPIPAPKKGQHANWHPVLRRFAVLPDGRCELAADVLAKGWEIDGEPACGAIELSKRLGLQGEHAVTHATGLRKALTLAAQREGDEKHVAAIMASPEATQRPAAAASLSAAWPASRMSIDRARAFLRGLPKETGDDTGAPAYAPRGSTFNQRRFDLYLLGAQRKAEKGDKDARAFCDAAAYAAAVHRAGRLSMPDALRACGIDIALFDGGAE